jgi:hypothetical protein
MIRHNHFNEVHLVVAVQKRERGSGYFVMTTLDECSEIRMYEVLLNQGDSVWRLVMTDRTECLE